MKHTISMCTQSNRELLIEKYIPPTKISEYGNEFWYNKHGETHSFNDQPAFISCWTNSNLAIKIWYKNAKRHRNKNKPAYVCYYSNGELMRKEWWKNGILIKSET